MKHDKAALDRAQDVPTLKTAQTITGLLLAYDEDVREAVLALVKQSLELARNGNRKRRPDDVPLPFAGSSHE
jgi:hypothetical protein